MADAMKEITPALSKAEKISRQWHNKIKRWRALYNLEHYGKARKPGEELYPDPTPLNVVDIAVGVILSNELKWTAIGFTPDPEEQRSSSKIEKYLQGTLDVNSEREDLHIPYEVIRNFCRDGAGVLYSVWDGDIAERESFYLPIEGAQPDPLTGEIQEQLVYGETPIRVQPICPLKMNMLPGGPKRWGWVFRKEEITVWDFEQMWGIKVKKYDYMREDEKREHKGTLVDCWRYIKKKVSLGQNPVLPQEEFKEKYVIQNALVYENSVVRPFRDMTGYDDIPYDIGFFKPIDKDDPEKWGHGIIAPMETTLKFLEKSINRRAKQISIYSSMPMIVQTHGRDIDFDLGMGNYQEMGLDEDIKWPQWPGNAPDVEAQISFFRARLQQSGFTDVIFGQGPNQVAGYALNQMTDQNRIRLEQPVKHLEHLWSRWARKVLRLTENMAGDAIIRVYGRINQQDFAHQIMGPDVSNYLVRAVIKPKFPNDEVREHAMGTQASPFMSKYTLLQKYFGINQPDDEIKRMMQEQAMLNPIMQQFLITETLMAEAKAGNAAAAMTLQQMFSGGIAGPQGRPPEPNAPEQLIGTQSPTGEAVPQAEGGEPAGQGIEDAIQNLSQQAPGLDGTI